MAWITPKVDWTPSPGIIYYDLNRIEGNISFIAANPSGTVLQLGPGSGAVTIGGGSNAVDLFQVVGTANFRRSSAGDQYIEIQNTSGGVSSSSSVVFRNTSGSGESGYIKSKRIDASNHTLALAIRAANTLSLIHI